MDVFTENFLLQGIKDQTILIFTNNGASPSVGLKISINGKLYFGKVFFHYPMDCNPTKGLNYEEQVYSHVVKKLNKMSPNFVTYLKTLIIKPENIVQDLYPIFDNLGDMLIKRERKSGKGCDIRSKTKIWDKKKNGIVIIINEWLESKDTLWDLQSRDELTDLDNQQIFAQLTISLIFMNIVGLNHNDLHFGNILISRMIKPTNLVYDVSGNTMKIQNCRFIVHIFDWDHAYSRDVGNNVKIDSDFYRRYGVYNEISPKSEMFKILCSNKSTDHKFTELRKTLVPRYDWIKSENDKQTHFACTLPKEHLENAFTLSDEDFLCEILKLDYFTNILS